MLSTLPIYTFKNNWFFPRTYEWNTKNNLVQVSKIGIGILSQVFLAALIADDDIRNNTDNKIVFPKFTSAIKNLINYNNIKSVKTDFVIALCLLPPLLFTVKNILDMCEAYKNRKRSRIKCGMT